jgi:magnesium transporter
MSQLSELADLARSGNMQALHDVLANAAPAEVLEELERMDKGARAVAFRALPKDSALAVFEDLDPAVQTELLSGLRDTMVAQLIEGMDPDDRAQLLDELPAKVARKLLSGLDANERTMTTALLGYPAESVGRRMSPELVAIPNSFTVGQALERIRTRGQNAETIYLLPIVGDGRILVGVVSLRRLLFTDKDTPVEEIMSEPVMVDAREDKEAAARIVREQGLLALPVVDGEARLLGLFTVDDAMSILEAEESEDIARIGAAEPLRRPYLTTSILGLVRSRVGWLLVLILAATLTVNVLDYFEATLAQVVALALFIPLLIGTGGNAGAQSATTVVRAMAVSDVRFRDLPRVVGREIVTGFLLGAVLAIVGFVPAGLLVDWDIAFVLASALIVVCTLATLIGSLIPMLAQRVGVDPAVVSAPFITTLVDATGLVVYFVIARAVLGL